MVLLDRAVRLYVAYALAGVFLAGCIALVGAVLPGGVAVFAGGVLAVLLVFAGLAWTALSG